MGKPITTSLKDAAAQIKRTCDHQVGLKPFFFFVGAGVSYPAVPLAPEIVKHCKEQLPDHKPPPNLSAMDEYSYWLGEAYNSANDRVKYFKSLIENQALPAASLRLAHLLLDGKISQLVATPNFDDFIERGLQLFGQSCAVCDHPATVNRIDPEEPGVQVLHAHGSYLFYDFKNLSGEIWRKRAPFR